MLILVNNEKRTFKFSSTATSVSECNHKETDITMIFYALQQQTNVLVCSNDTDILVFMVVAYVLNKINEKWVMKIESTKFINIRKTGISRTWRRNKAFPNS